MNRAVSQPAAIEVREIVYREPVQLARRLRGQAHLTLFESSLRQERLGRYSFLACNPSSTLKVVGGETFVDDVKTDEAALSILGRLLRDNARPTAAGLPPFQGGMAGYISYDFGRRLEPKARIPDFTALAPELMLHRFDTGIAFDHLQERAWIMNAGEAAAADQLELLIEKPATPIGSSVIEGWRSNFTRAGV